MRLTLGDQESDNLLVFLGYPRLRVTMTDESGQFFLSIGDSRLEAGLVDFVECWQVRRSERTKAHSGWTSVCQQRFRPGAQLPAAGRSRPRRCRGMAKP